MRGGRKEIEVKAGRGNGEGSGGCRVGGERQVEKEKENVI